jgi:hypothetical protein
MTTSMVLIDKVHKIIAKYPGDHELQISVTALTKAYEETLALALNLERWVHERIKSEEEFLIGK